MHLIQALKNYVDQMVEEAGVGLKCVLMDRETTSILSMVYSQTEMLEKEVYLFERIDRISSVEPIKYLKCIVFIRAVSENINYLMAELRNPKFGQYHIYFSNIVSNSDIMSLAEADEHELVRDIQEIYADYIAVSPNLFSVNVSSGCYKFRKWNQQSLQRSVEGIISLLLSLQKNPKIRYQGSSDMCRQLAENIHNFISKEYNLFSSKSFPHPSEFSPVLLIIDRSLDPFTPLLNQWTYQAMLHELLTINNNRIELSGVQGISKEMREVVVSAEQDEFYASNMYKNFGEIGINIKVLMEDFQDKTKNQKKVETISDMKEFIEQYPQFKKMSGTISKHVILISELSRLVAAHNLMDVSEAEQEMACQYEHSRSLKKVIQLLDDPKVRDLDKLRLVMLYALRFEKHSNQEIQELKKILKQKGLSEDMIRAISNLQSFVNSANQGQKEGDLLSTVNEVFKKKIIKGLKGVQNIYTQHTPVLREIIEDLLKGRLKANQFPYLNSSDKSVLSERPQDIIIFMIGGTTYEEALHIEQLNRQPHIRIILGSSGVHNLHSFLEEVRSASIRSQYE